MEHCDVLIVGGGPAGSSCAWQLSRAGRDVVLLDKAAFPRDKVCAGWITPTVLGTLELDKEDYRHGRVFQPITSLRTSRLGSADVQSDYGKAVSYGIRRCEFDHYLLQRSGARAMTGEGIKTLTRKPGHWIVNGRIATPMLVGAGGHFCPVARHLGSRPGAGESIVSAQEWEFEMAPEQLTECSVRGQVPELFFCRDLKGYGWVFRKENVLNVGLGREDNRKLAEQVRAFCERLQSAGKIPRPLPGRAKGHAYLLYGKSRRILADNGVILVGDAAGLAYDQSGEGIRPAVESGILAAETILAAGGDYRKEQLAPYTARIMDRFGPRDHRDGLFAALPMALRQYLAGKLLANRWFARHVVLNRWFLHVHQPPLKG